MVKVKKANKARADKDASNEDKTPVSKSEESILRIQKGPKCGRPLSKKILKGNILAKKSIRTGKISAEELKRKKERDTRTLYVRFKKCEKLPMSDVEIQQLHQDITQVRLLRQARKKKDKGGIHFAFLEFPSKETCRKAFDDLNEKVFLGGKLHVDFVGAQSKYKNDKRRKRTPKMPINPLRLFVTGSSKINLKNLKKAFPKSKEVVIPKRSLQKGKSFAFIHFETLAEAKAAFDKAKDIKIEGDGITVVYAKMPKKPLNLNADSDMKTSKAAKKRKMSESGDDDQGKMRVMKEDKAENVNSVENDKKDKRVKDESEEEDSDDDGEVENDNESEEESGDELENDEESSDEELENDDESGEEDDE